MCVCTVLPLPLSVGLPFYAVAPSSFDAKAVVKLYAYAPISGAPRTYMDMEFNGLFELIEVPHLTHPPRPCISPSEAVPMHFAAFC